MSDTPAMMTVRDVIAKAMQRQHYAEEWVQLDAQAVLDEILSAPLPLRLELVGMLNPWRTIETLREGCGTVLLYDEEWSETLGEIQAGRKDDGCFFGSEGVEIHPTHWLPLPAPPSEDKPK